MVIVEGEVFYICALEGYVVNIIFNLKMRFEIKKSKYIGYLEVFVDSKLDFFVFIGFFCNCIVF